MLINQSYFIDSCDDVELNIKRESKLEYRITYDNEKEMKAIICIIPGFGGDADDNYREYLAQIIAQKFEVCVLSVNYHCIGNRLQFGAMISMDDIDKFILQENCKVLNIAIPTHLEKIIDILSYLNDNIQKYKEQQIFNKEARMSLSLTFQPTKNEYQNFGIMQAQDIINAILHIKSNPPFKIMGGGMPTILIGSSHGGYLAYLAAKITPWNVDGVIDNSSYVKTPLQYLGFGKEIDYKRHYEASDPFSFENLDLLFYSKTFWTSNKFLKNYFSEDRRKIRDVLNYKHLDVLSDYDISYIAYHSVQDDYIAPFEDKIALYDYFQKNNFDAKLNLIQNESQIDGKFIKNLDHGMDMSIKMLIEKELPVLLEKVQFRTKKDNLKKIINYPCENLIYIFYERNNKVNLEIKENSC